MPPKKYKCALCRKEYERSADPKEDFFPFCSERCRLMDLGSWLKEEYVTSRELSPEEIAEASLGEEEGE
jgi:hypothetical protein